MIKDSSRFTTPFLTLLSSLPFPSSLSARPPTCCTHLDTDRERRGKGGYGQGPPERASESKSAKEDLCTEIRGVAGRAQDARVPQGVVDHYGARSERVSARVSAREEPESAPTRARTHRRRNNLTYARISQHLLRCTEEW